jgi:hypothetical protein
MRANDCHGISAAAALVTNETGKPKDRNVRVLRLILLHRVFQRNSLAGIGGYCPVAKSEEHHASGGNTAYASWTTPSSSGPEGPL